MKIFCDVRIKNKKNCEGTKKCIHNKDFIFIIIKKISKITSKFCKRFQVKCFKDKTYFFTLYIYLNLICLILENQILLSKISKKSNVTN